MARAIKKVKVKVKKQRTKKFWITLGSACLLVIAAISVGLYFLLRNTDSEYTHFKSIKEETSITYNDLLLKVENAKNDHMFVFVYDHTWDPEDNTEDKKFEDKVILLYTKVVEYNNDYEDIFDFYIVDVTIEANQGILSDSKFGSPTANTLVYLYGGIAGTYPENVDPEDMEDGDYEEPISGSEIIYVTQAIEYIKYLIAEKNK